MHFINLHLFLLAFSCNFIWSESIQTFYGTIEVEEAILIELIHSPAFERLKHLHQYGVSYYTKTCQEEYTRHAHSLGVFALLREKNASLEEQIAGLLHDVSHTAFSHVGDWVYGMPQQESDYQSTIHNTYLAQSGIEQILKRHNYTVEQISPYRNEFQMLEQPLPNLCADRIDYNIQGAYFQHFLTYEEAMRLFRDLTFELGKWTIKEEELAIKLTRFSIFMTEYCWGSAWNHISSQWLADAILHGFQIGLILPEQFQFGVDQEIWDLLTASADPFIQQRMEMLRFPDAYYQVVDPIDTQIFLRYKSRGIDPWISQAGSIVPLTSLNSELKEALEQMKLRALRGWPVRLAHFEKDLRLK